MTKWFLDIYRSCLCLKQLSVCDICKVRAVCTEVGGGWENQQVFAGVTVGKDSKCKWCGNVEMLMDIFTSCGHLQQRLAVSLGALFFCVLRKTCMVLYYHRAASTVLPHKNNSSQWSYSWDIEISGYWYCQPSNIYFEFVSRIFLYFWLIALLAIALTLVYMERAFFQKQESLGIMQHILYRCSCFSEPITSIFVFCSPFALFQDY